MKAVNIPAGTEISFKDDSTVYRLRHYIIPACESPCNFLHDECYEEPYVVVDEVIGRAFPLSKINHIFDPATHIGRQPTQEELQIIEE